jgi:DNA polymerase (family X)
MANPDRSGRRNDALPSSNEEVAHDLTETGNLLESQGANPFRVRSYRTAAQMLRLLPQPVHEILKAEGLPGLLRLPGIGESLARSIEQLALTGRLGLLDRLRGEAGPEHLLSTVTGIGPKLARQIHEGLGIERLEDLEVAAHDGRLDRLPGFGPRRVHGIRESLAGRFRRRLRLPIAPVPPVAREVPSVEELLDVDREYRQKAEAGELRRIAPRRFNPTAEAWLPILHTHRRDHQYTALYSNTARAHELEMTRDWVVIFRDDDHGDGQWTVVTARFGPQRGCRVVRGRESESLSTNETTDRPPDQRPPEAVGRQERSQLPQGLGKAAN